MQSRSSPLEGAGCRVPLEHAIAKRRDSLPKESVLQRRRAGWSFVSALELDAGKLALLGFDAGRSISRRGDARLWEKNTLAQTAGQRTNPDREIHARRGTFLKAVQNSEWRMC